MILKRDGLRPRTASCISHSRLSQLDGHNDPSLIFPNGDFFFLTLTFFPWPGVRPRNLGRGSAHGYDTIKFHAN